MLDLLIGGIKRIVLNKTQSFAGFIFTDGQLGYEDLKGIFQAPTSGALSGADEDFDGVTEKGYNANDIITFLFHVEHKDHTGGDKFLHVHIGIASGATASGSNLVITAVVKHRYHNLLGSGQALRTPSPAAKTFTFTVTPAQLNEVKGDTLVVEQLVAQSGGSASLLDSDSWLSDDDIAVQFTVTTLPTITGGTSQRLRFPHSDFHRTNLYGGTPRRFFVNGSFW